MKALSIQQPWAWAVLYGGKTVENRKWPTRFRGRFIIHAGKRFDPDGFADLRPLLDALNPPRRGDLTLGAFLGTATLVRCTTPLFLPDNKWAFGPWCFELDDICPFATPVPGKGTLGFFDVPDAIASIAV